VKGIVVETTCF